MSKSGSLKEENLHRLKDFLKTGSLQISAKKFRLGVPAFRECIVNTTQALVIEMNSGDDNFIGTITHTKDIYANKDLILGLLERLKAGVAISSEKRIGQMSKTEFKGFLDECLSEYFRRR